MLVTVVWDLLISNLTLLLLNTLKKGLILISWENESKVMIYSTDKSIILKYGIMQKYKCSFFQEDGN